MGDKRRAASTGARRTVAYGVSVCLVGQQCSPELPPGSDPKMLEREDGGPWPSNAPRGTESGAQLSGDRGAPGTLDI